MKNVRAILVIAALITALSAFSARAKDAPATADDLQKRFETALKTKDKQAIIELYDWQGVSADMKAMQEQIIGMLFAEDAKSVKLGPLPPGFQPDNVRNGIRYHPNVAVVGVIELQYSAAGNTAQMPYGTKDKAFYLSNVLQEKVASVATQEKNLNLNIHLAAPTEEPSSFVCAYVYLSGGKEIKKEIAKEFPSQPSTHAGSTTTHSQSKVFWGDGIKSCTVRKTSAAGKIQLVISADGKEVFQSEWETTDKPIVYQPK